MAGKLVRRARFRIDSNQMLSDATGVSIHVDTDHWLDRVGSVNVRPHVYCWDVIMNVTTPLPIHALALIVEKARAFDVLVDTSSLGLGSCSVEDDLAEALNCLTDDELTKLLALLWVGRGNFDRESWHEAVVKAREAKNKRIVRYLIDSPMLGFFLEEGLAEMGVGTPIALGERVR